MTSAGWAALAPLMFRLTALASRTPLGEDLQWRVGALVRAFALERPHLFPLALGATGRGTPESVDAWRHDRAVADQWAEVAVWLLADAACALDAGESTDGLVGARLVLDAWAKDGR